VRSAAGAAAVPDADAPDDGFASPPPSFSTAMAATATTATQPNSSGSLLPLRRAGRNVSSRADDTGDEATAIGAGAAVGALRIWPGMVCAVRAFSVAAWLLPASAASLITTAGVEGSSFGT
jgi:hypothetical protein